ncbi:MAG TPA: DUF5777 family beta-barrel protein [Chitinophagaceae bacterium]
MKKYLLLFMVMVSVKAISQDSLMNNLVKDMNTPGPSKNKPVKIFNSERNILTNTTETVGKGKMDFRVTHYFDDMAGANGGFKNFFGMDNSTDIRIGFHFGITDRLDISIARAKGGSPRTELRMTQLYEISMKYQLLRQLENDPSHPIALSFFFSNIISGMDTAKTPTYNFQDLGDRMSQTFQLIIAKKIGKVSLQLNPTFLTQGYLQPNDLQKSMFALGGAVRVPVTKGFNVIVDYFHPFRTEESENSFNNASNFNPPIKFFDPLGIGFEFITPGHVFHLNFHNSTEIQENRFIPYTVKSWGEGEFRWGFNISRKFVLWREKPTPTVY